MPVNDYGAPLDRNGYAPSIIQTDTSECYLCKRRSTKLDRHEPFGGALRPKSKRLGMWVSLCHDSCHIYGDYSAHGNIGVGNRLKRAAQRAAMRTYHWTMAEWMREFYKNYLMEDKDE